MKFLLLLFSLCHAAKILVLYENPQVKVSHSNVLDALEGQGFDLSFKSADDPSLELIKYGVNVYKSVLVLAPSVEEFGGKVSSQAMVDFMDNGGNILIAADTNVGAVIRDVAAEVGVEIDETGTKVIDHANVDDELDDGSHTTVIVNKEQVIDAEIITGPVSGSLRFDGVGMHLDDANELVFPIVFGSDNSYSWYPEEAITEYPMALGKELVLVAGLQARNNARIVICGSLKMLSDEFGAIEGQAEFAKSVVLWAVRARGVIQERRVTHNLQGKIETPEYYTIKENVHYEMAIEELVNSEWVPYGGKDVQLDFHRLDPFIRTTMKNENGLQVANFQLPDVYGVFQFKVNYNRLGYTSISHSVQISVRPLRHNQYERFITTAYPYYFSSFSMMIGVSLLAFTVLYHSDTKPKKE